MNLRAVICFGIMLLVGFAPSANAFQGRGHQKHHRRYEKRHDREDRYDRWDRYDRKHRHDRSEYRDRGHRRHKHSSRHDYHYRPPRGYHLVRDYRIPRGHMPPVGLCRVWYVNRPPGHQPPPVLCYDVMGYGEEWVIVTYDGYVYGPPSYYEYRRRPHRPEIVIRGEIRF